MVNDTSHYAEKLLNKTIIMRRSRYKDWKRTDVVEMKKFIGLLLHTEIVKLPIIRDCWPTDHFLKTHVWSNTMSKNRFLLLLRFWYFEIEGDNEMLEKVAYLMNNLNKKMKEIYCPDQSLSLDNSMMFWRGWLIFRQ